MAKTSLSFDQQLENAMLQFLRSPQYSLEEKGMLHSIVAHAMNDKSLYEALTSSSDSGKTTIKVFNKLVEKDILQLNTGSKDFCYVVFPNNMVDTKWGLPILPQSTKGKAK